MHMKLHTKVNIMISMKRCLSTCRHLWRTLIKELKLIKRGWTAIRILKSKPRSIGVLMRMCMLLSTSGGSRGWIVGGPRPVGSVRSKTACACES